MSKIEPLQAGILTALQALDNQVAREMQRNPQQASEKGTRKWEPIEKRVELVAGYVLDQIEAKNVELDSVLILAQGMSKALQILVTDLGKEGLGKVRSEYCLAAADSLGHDAEQMRNAIQDTYGIT